MAYAVSGTLVGGVVSTVTVRGWTYGINVINRTGTGQLWVTINGSTPSVAGNDCFVVLGARNFPCNNADTVVKIICSGANDYTVEGAVPTS
jgi:hypothetical protein